MKTTKNEKLIQSSSDKAFKKNIATEIKAGKPQKQAVAIAYDVKRRNEGKIKEGISARDWQYLDSAWDRFSRKAGSKSDETIMEFIDKYCRAWSPEDCTDIFDRYSISQVVSEGYMTDDELDEARSKLFRKKMPEWSDEEKKEYSELTCRNMINSVLAYTPGATSGKWTPDKIFEKSEYLKRYADGGTGYAIPLGKERVLELIKEQMSGIEEIETDTYTDSEGLSYNSIRWKNRANESISRPHKDVVKTSGIKKFYVEFEDDNGDWKWTMIKADDEETAKRIAANAGINKITTFEEIKKKVAESKRWFVRKYKGCSIHDMGDTYVVTNQHGLNIGQSKTESGCEGIIDEYIKNNNINEEIMDSLLWVADQQGCGEEARKIYSDIKKEKKANESKGRGMIDVLGKLDELKESTDLDELHKKALKAYDDNDMDWFESLSDDELAELWAACMLSKENPYGRAYDDEVYDVIWYREDDGSDIMRKAGEIYSQKYHPLVEKKNEAIEDDIIYNDEKSWDKDRYKKISHKMVYDSDGFTTDYTLYYDKEEDNYFTIFGDDEIYGPDDYHDADFEGNQEAAMEWMETYGEEDDGIDFDESLNEESADDDDRPLRVCRNCLMGIEAHEGNQHAKTIYVDEDEEEESKCDWCEESGFDTLYEI